MENPFKQLNEPEKEVPKEIKRKVMSDISYFKFLTDIVGLFSSNYARAAESFFKKNKKVK